MPGILIRPYVDADLETITAIAAEREGRDPRDIRRSLVSLIESKREQIHVAEVAGAVVGYGKCGYLDHAEGRNTIPIGWYLTGVIVASHRRRRGVGIELTRARIQWLSGRANEVYYFANSANHASIALHEAFGFEEVARNLNCPGIQFTGGVSVLFRLDVRASRRGVDR